MKLFSLVAVLAAGLISSVLGQRSVDRGLNIPPTQGTTRDGAFFPGLYQYEYQPEAVTSAAHRAGFSALRLAVNVETANNVTALQKHKQYIDAAGGRGIICMFDTAVTPGGSWPRSGTVTGKIDQVAQAWKSVHSVFEPYGENVLYEIFNEPWGYKNNAVAYVSDMLGVVRAAGLPEDRVILAGLYGSADVQSVARAGWPGYLAYHVYVFWLPEGQRSPEGFSNKIQADLKGLSHKVFITEFGVGLDGLKANVDEDELKQDVLKHVDQKTVTGDWHTEQPEDVEIKSICAKHPGNAWCKRKAAALVQKQRKPAAAIGADVAAAIGAAIEPAAATAADAAAVTANLGADVAAAMGLDVPVGANTAPQTAIYQNDTMAFLRGMRLALSALKSQGVGVRGLYHWHGWHNGDTWDFWDAANARSSRMIQMMMMDQGEGALKAGAKAEDDGTDLFLSEDFVEDSQQVHMLVARQLGPKSSGECPAECGAKHCVAGNAAEIGGKHVTGNYCTHNCSRVYGASRFCGVGAGYQDGDAINCGGCASPPMCFGLPCWTQKAIAPRTNHTTHATFLQKRAHHASLSIS